MAVAPRDIREHAGTDLADREIQTFIDVAGFLVGDYAPSAPQANRDLAVIMLCAYWLQSVPGGPAVGMQAGNDINVQLAPAGHAAAFMRCGAKAVLSRWVSRRAEAIR